LSRIFANYIGPADLSWWVWILLAVGLWFLQLIISAFSDGTIGENKHTVFFWTVRAALIFAMVVSAVVGVIRFVKWVWNS
jgi:tetrahydromethanopterin S-methyltransferase subunit D